MPELSIAIQLATLLSILLGAAAIFVRIGRVWQQVDYTSTEVMEIRRELRSLGDLRTEIRVTTDAHGTRLASVERRLDRLEGGPQPNHGRLAST